MTIRSASWRSAKGHQDFHDRPSFFFFISFDVINKMVFTPDAGDVDHCQARLGTPDITVILQ